jgi:tRNA dimethylallyltransferase
MIVILGPTASGKTSLAANVASELDGEVISADSRQVYKGLDIGTGKDLEEYVVNQKKIPYHLIDIIEPGHEYNLFEFRQDFLKTCKEIKDRNKLPVLCGGTGLYIEAVLRGFHLPPAASDPEFEKDLQQKSQDELIRILKGLRSLHNTTDIIDRKRLIKAILIAASQNPAPGKETHPLSPPHTHTPTHKHTPDSPHPPALPILRYRFDRDKLSPEPPHPPTPSPEGEGEALLKKIEYSIFGIRFEREEIRRRITKRLEYRLQHGLTDEVKRLLDTGISPEQLKFYGLEYRFITMYLLKEITNNDMFNLLKTAIHQYAKRQMTWFRKMERAGFIIHWIDGTLDTEQKIRAIKAIL